jgi:hypothetical protein
LCRGTEGERLGTPALDTRDALRKEFAALREDLKDFERRMTVKVMIMAVLGMLAVVAVEKLP